MKRVVGAAVALATACSPFSASSNTTQEDGGATTTIRADGGAGVTSASDSGTRPEAGPTDAGEDAPSTDPAVTMLVRSQSLSHDNDQSFAFGIPATGAGHTLLLAIATKDSNPPSSVASGNESWTLLHTSNAHQCVSLWTLAANGTETSISIQQTKGESALMVVTEWAAVTPLEGQDDDNNVDPPVMAPGLSAAGKTLVVSSTIVESTDPVTLANSSAFTGVGNPVVDDKLTLAFAYLITNSPDDSSAVWDVGTNSKGGVTRWDAVTLTFGAQ